MSHFCNVSSLYIGKHTIKDIVLPTLLREIYRKIKMRNIVLLIDPPKDGSDISLKAGNMILNRFCIDEEASFETTGIYYLNELEKDYSMVGRYDETKGTGYRLCSNIFVRILLEIIRVRTSG